MPLRGGETTGENDEKDDEGERDYPPRATLGLDSSIAPDTTAGVDF